MNTNLDYLREDIKKFKRNFDPKNGFDNYRNFMRKLDDIERFAYSNKEDKPIIINEKNNLKKFIWKEYYLSYNYEFEKGNYSNALNLICRLEKELNIDTIDFPNDVKEQYKLNIKELKKHCNYSLKIKEIDKQKENHNYEKALENLNDLFNSIDGNEEEKIKSINLYIRSTKTDYIKYVTQKNSKLLYTNNTDKIDDMIKDFENISKFRSEPDLNSLISEANKVYAVALNKKIEEKEKLNENCDEEKEKLKYLKDIDKIDIDNFCLNKNKSNNFKNLNNYKEDNILNNDISESKSQIILKETVDTYFKDLNEENKGNKDYNDYEKQFKEDIYDQINKYN